MKQVDFNQLSIAIDSLSPSQRHLLLERLQHPDATPAIIEHLEQQLQSDLRCPTCNHDQIHRWSTLKELQRYRCRACLKTFTALTVRRWPDCGNASCGWNTQTPCLALKHCVKQRRGATFICPLLSAGAIVS